jgi:hypothetical protein
MQNLSSKSTFPVYSIVNLYLNCFISLMGVVFNVINIIIFIKIIKKESPSNGSCQMYKYLLVRSINDLLNFSSNSIYAAYNCEWCDLKKFSYLLQVWYIYFYWYFHVINEISSSFMEIAFTLDCLISIKKRYKFFLTKKFSSLLILASISFCSIFCIFYIFSYEIVVIPTSTNGSSTNVQYKVEDSKFQQSVYFAVI